MTTRLIGLDYGSKTVGVAVSDPTGLIAQPLETIVREHENKLRRTLARIAEIVREYEAGAIVLGYPLNMNATLGERAEKTKAFAGQVEARTGLKVILWDERLSTQYASRALMESGVRRENRKQFVDQIAAVFILQGYLDSLNMEQTLERNRFYGG